jgi:hypothetical protein
MPSIQRIVVVALSAFALSGCAEMQVKRDLQVANDADQYRASLSNAVEFNGSSNCTLAPALKQWQAIPFSPQTPILKLPNGLSAAAYCLKIPKGARAFELYGAASDGLTFHQISMVHPSAMGLDEKFAILKDVPVPRMKPDEGWTEFRISGITLLTGELQNSAYLIVYVNPESFKAGVDVMVPGSTIPVPYAPYGEVKIRFHPGGGT